MKRRNQSYLNYLLIESSSCHDVKTRKRYFTSASSRFFFAIGLRIRSMSSPAYSFTASTFTFVQHVEPIWSRHHAPNMRGVAGERWRKKDGHRWREKKEKRKREREKEREQAAPTPNSRYVIKRSLSSDKVVVKSSNVSFLFDPIFR